MNLYKRGDKVRLNQAGLDYIERSPLPMVWPSDATLEVIGSVQLSEDEQQQLKIGWPDFSDDEYAGVWYNCALDGTPVATIPESQLTPAEVN